MLTRLFILAGLLTSCGSNTTTVHKRYAVCTLPKVQTVTVEKEVVVTQEKVKTVRLPLEFYSNRCRKDILKVGKNLYVVDNDRITLLDHNWYQAYNQCKLRIHNGKLQVKGEH